DGTFAMVSGFAAGTALVQAPEIAALAFTGSQRGGMALWRAAAEREVVIPVYAEMGTVNPVVVTRAAAHARAEAVASGYVGSFTLGMGQFCTKPGLLLVPAGSGLAALVGQALTDAAPAGWLLTDGIAAGYAQGLGELTGAGATVLAEITAPGGGGSTGSTAGWAAGARALGVPAGLIQRGSRLTEECFGPVGLVTEYADDAELAALLAALQGTLAACVMAEPDDPQLPDLLEQLTPLAGRVAVNDWPTGVAFRWAQQHGGPWPATTVPSATSVGAAALDRFTRPVTYQSVPDAALPPTLQAANPWGLPRRVDGAWVSA
ncbi:MAG: aldehyde dehydrogenase family protein, partial [Nocardioides sp.]